MPNCLGHECIIMILVAAPNYVDMMPLNSCKALPVTVRLCIIIQQRITAKCIQSSHIE